MRKHVILGVCVVALVLGAVTLVSAERPKPAEKLAIEGPSNAPVVHTGPAVRKLDTAVVTTPSKSRAAGVITYDDGVVNMAPVVPSHCWGNQFDTALGSPVLASGSVTQLQFFIVGTGTDNVFLSVFGPVSGTTAPGLTSVSVPVAGASVWSTHTFATAVSYTGASFLAGVWYSGDTIGLGDGTVGGQGFHGMHINDVSGTSFTAPGTFNALMRAGGDVLVPVELMSFLVE